MAPEMLFWSLAHVLHNITPISNVQINLFADKNNPQAVSKKEK